MSCIEKVWYNFDLKNIIYSYLITCHSCHNNNVRDYVKGADGNWHCFHCSYKWVYPNYLNSFVEKKFEI